jgi:hypothetical protein
MENSVLEEPGSATQPSDAPTIVVVQTVEEDRGFPVPVATPDRPLPPAGPSLPAVGRLVTMPFCEMVSWPLALVRWLLGAPSKPPASD